MAAGTGGKDKPKPDPEPTPIQEPTESKAGKK